MFWFIIMLPLCALFFFVCSNGGVDTISILWEDHTNSEIAIPASFPASTLRMCIWRFSR